MKNVINYFSIVAVLTLLGLSTTVQAQQTIAHVDADALISEMIEYKKAKSDVEAYGKILQKELEAEQAKMQQYYQGVMQKVQTGVISPAQQKEEEAKLQKMQADLQKKAGEADQKLVDKEQSLISPLYDKFNAALEKVAAANGLAYIIDVKLALYTGGGKDVTNLVKAELGIN
jgi:outer membrane protein